MCVAERQHTRRWELPPSELVGSSRGVTPIAEEGDATRSGVRGILAATKLAAVILASALPRLGPFAGVLGAALE